LNSQKIDFVVVGAHAVAFHGYPRFTGDIDLLIRPTAENAKQLTNALNMFGFPVQPGFESALIQPEKVIQLGRAPNRIDLLTSITGVTFDEAWQDSIVTELDGITVRMLGRNTLLKNKQASGRRKDLADIEGILRPPKDSD
jgi:hypothetical protein